MQSLFQPWVFWGLAIGLPLLPLLIHLINMMRRRRVKWAAMEFLLASHKRHRTSVWFRQFLLLAMRMAAVALLVFVLSHAGCRSGLMSLLGGRTTHHYVLLDDSFSMSDRTAGATAFDEARRFIRTLAVTASEENSPHAFTLVRFSRAAGARTGDAQPATGATASAAGEGGDSAALDLDQIADMNSEPVTADFEVLMEERTRSFQPTDLAVGPGDALALALRLVRETQDERRLVYVVSDFRSKEWESPAQLNALLEDMTEAKAELHFVQCVREQHGNLAVVDVSPAEETRAAGVPLFVNVKVKNFGAAPVRKAQLKVRATFHDDAGASQGSESAPAATGEGAVQELPAVVIDEIRPGETVSRRVQVFFPGPGRHVVEAILPEDAVAADNRRWCVIDFPEGEPVLIIDGSAEGRHAYFLQTAFEPGAQTITGVRPQVHPEAFLRDASPEALRSFTAIYLLDVGRLDARAIENLERYASEGGGVAFFLGEHVSAAAYNADLYRDGKGLFPLPLAADDLLPAELENSPDIDAGDHPVFGVALGERNPLIRLVTVDRYFRAQEGWRPDPQSTVQVIARLRNQAPLAVERQFGAGRVAAFLTTAAPVWNNWAKNPSFVVTVLKLQSHLAAAQRQVDSMQVGSPISLQLESQQYLPNVVFTAPGDELTGRQVIERAAVRPQSDSPVLNVSLGKPPAAVVAASDDADSSAGVGEPASTSAHSAVGETDRAGVYEARLKTSEGGVEVRRFALNVDANEGDLSLGDSRTLLAAVSPLEPRLLFADEFTEGEVAQTAGDQFNRLLTFTVLCGLAGLLLCEQFVAYVASYHPAKGAERA